MESILVYDCYYDYKSKLIMPMNIPIDLNNINYNIRLYDN